MEKEGLSSEVRWDAYRKTHTLFLDFWIADETGRGLMVSLLLE